MLAERTPIKYTIKQFQPTAWKSYKAIRLEALQTNPEMFGSNYEKESAYADEQWVSFLEKDSRGLFGLFYEGELLGLTAIAQKPTDSDTAILYASFIHPAHRGNGLSKLFFTARINWAKDRNCKFLEVSHRAGNVYSKAAILRNNFTFSKVEETTWPDGKVADELFYTLAL